MVNSLKYLGLVVDDKRGMYSTQKRMMVGRAKWRVRDLFGYREKL